MLQSTCLLLIYTKELCPVVGRPPWLQPARPSSSCFPHRHHRCHLAQAQRRVSAHHRLLVPGVGVAARQHGIQDARLHRHVTGHHVPTCRTSSWASPSTTSSTPTVQGMVGASTPTVQGMVGATQLRALHGP
jgi:hypothetical protein